MELKRVVVTGLGAITPVGNTLEATWNSLLNGVSGAAPIQGFDASRFKTQFACEVKDFKAADFIDRKEIRKMDLYEQYAVVAAMQAVQDSGMDLETIDKDNIGVVLGVGIGGIHTFEEQISEYALTHEEKGPRFSPFFIPKMIADIASGQISIMYGFHGPNYTTTSACASSTNAIADAFNLIRLGKASAIITGGAEAAITPGGLGGFNAMHALSTRNDDPQRASRPFSKSRDGFVMGEGAAALILESEEHAKARGARVYAELAGTGVSADSYHITAPDPAALGATRALHEALEDGNIDPKTVVHINAHATSTPAGDLPEATAMHETFGEHTKNIAVSATKSMTGHLLGGAGALEAVLTVLALHHRTAPCTINLDNKDPQIDLDVVTEARELPAGEIVALSNSFGFGGHNAVVAFRSVED